MRNKSYETTEPQQMLVEEPAITFAEDKLARFVAHSFKQKQEGRVLPTSEVQRRLDAKWGTL